jgi:hypothetical protein
VDRVVSGDLRWGWFDRFGDRDVAEAFEQFAFVEHLAGMDEATRCGR